MAGLCVALVGAMLAPCVLADVVVMKNGDRLTGTVSRFRAGKLDLDTSYAGTVTIDTDEVESLVTDGDVTVLMKDYTRLIGRLAVSAGRASVITAPDAAPIPVDAKRVASLEPGRLGGKDWQFTGRINLGISNTDGNTDLRRYNFDSEAIARRDRNRWTATARANEATDTKVETEMNAIVGLKYDRFVDERLYGYGATTFEHDRFKDLRLRSTYGAGMGFQVFEGRPTNLALEAGVDRVNALFFDAPDERFFALRLGSRFDRWLWDDAIQVFNNNQLYASLEDIRTSFLRTQSGLRFPLRSGILASLLFNLDWDGNPAPERKSVDRQLIFSLGYRW